MKTINGKSMWMNVQNSDNTLHYSLAKKRVAFAERHCYIFPHISLLHITHSENFMKRIIATLLMTLGVLLLASAQERTILVPKRVAGAPFAFADSADLLGQAWRWFYEGDNRQAISALKAAVTKSGFTLNSNSYYVVVANLTDSLNPMGMFHGSDDFLSTRMFGLDSNNLYYICISRTREAPSFVSTLATAKDSPFLQNLPAFLSLFPILQQVRPFARDYAETTWVDIRQFNVPKVYQDFSDLSFIVKKTLSDDRIIAQSVFDNTKKEHWSYGIATAITSIEDVDIVVGEDGKIIVRPKPNLDLATFGVINYHFWAVDTKRKTFETSVHLLGGLRIADYLELLIGVGAGVSLDFIDLHLFAGYSVEFANELRVGYKIGDQVATNADPFATAIRGKPRFGLEIKFP